MQLIIPWLWVFLLHGVMQGIHGEPLVPCDDGKEKACDTCW